MAYMFEHPLFTAEELQEIRKRAEENSYRFSDVFLTRALQSLADAAGHVEGILGAYEHMGGKP